MKPQTLKLENGPIGSYQQSDITIESCVVNSAESGTEIHIRSHYSFDAIEHLELNGDIRLLISRNGTVLKFLEFEASFW